MYLHLPISFEFHIEIDLINRATGALAEISSDEFIANFIEKNYAKSCETAEYLLRNGFEPIMLIRFLSNYLQKLYHAKIETDIAGIDFETAIKAQKLFFKTEGTFRKHLKTTQLVAIISYLKQLEALEIKIKTTTKIAPKLLFTIFLQESLTR